MLMNLNGRERSLEAFQCMCSSITPKLRVQKAHRPEQGELSLIEITLDTVNWSVLVFGVVVLGSLVWYAVRARHYFKGPIKEA